MSIKVNRVYHIDNAEDLKDFLTQCEELGFIWASGDKPTMYLGAWEFPVLIYIDLLEVLIRASSKWSGLATMPLIKFPSNASVLSSDTEFLKELESYLKNFKISKFTVELKKIDIFLEHLRYEKRITITTTYHPNIESYVMHLLARRRIDGN